MVEKEIQKAKDLYARFGDQILGNKNHLDLIKKYRSAIETTREKMKALNMIKACSVCSDKCMGGCCFVGVEKWYDAMLLLVNLLLGANIPEVRMVKKGCMFVGLSGCELLARHSFCINYLCSPFKDSLSLTDQKNFLSVAGNEIFCGIQVEQSVQKWIASQKIK